MQSSFDGKIGYIPLYFGHIQENFSEDVFMINRYNTPMNSPPDLHVICPKFSSNMGEHASLQKKVQLQDFTFMFEVKHPSTAKHQRFSFAGFPAGP